MSNSEVKQDYKWLRRFSLQFITEKDFEKIEKSSIRLKYKKGEIILKQGALSTHIAFLEKGIVKFNYQNETSRNLILTIVAAPKILGGANLFYKENNLFSFVAVEDCEVILINSDILMEIMMNNARFSVVLFQVASQMFKTSVLNFISLAYKQKEGRIADILLFLSAEVYSKLEFQTTLTRKEIAEFAGCSTENVIMSFSKWQKDNIIETTGKFIKIIDLERLKYISKIG